MLRGPEIPCQLGDLGIRFHSFELVMNLAINLRSSIQACNEEWHRRSYSLHLINKITAMRRKIKKLTSSRQGAAGSMHEYQYRIHFLLV